MKSITTYITEKLRLDNPKNYNYFPKTREELDDIIAQLIEERGNNADLNDIDVSNITDMSGLFASRYDVVNFKYNKKYDFSEFNGDISNWDVSNVIDMHQMFYNSVFNEDISKWNVSNVKDMMTMFGWSFFNKDISNWRINNNCYTGGMYNGSRLEKKYQATK